MKRILFGYSILALFILSSIGISYKIYSQQGRIAPSQTTGIINEADNLLAQQPSTVPALKQWVTNAQILLKRIESSGLPQTLPSLAINRSNRINRRILEYNELISASATQPTTPKKPTISATLDQVTSIITPTLPDAVITDITAKLPTTPSQQLQRLQTILKTAQDNLNEQLATKKKQQEVEISTQQKLYDEALLQLNTLEQQLALLAGKNKELDANIALMLIDTVAYLAEVQKKLSQKNIPVPESLQVALDNATQKTSQALARATQTPAEKNILETATLDNKGLQKIVQSVTKKTLDLPATELPTPIAQNIVQAAQTLTIPEGNPEAIPALVEEKATKILSKSFQELPTPRALQSLKSEQQIVAAQTKVENIEKNTQENLKILLSNVKPEIKQEVFDTPDVQVQKKELDTAVGNAKQLIAKQEQQLPKEQQQPSSAIIAANSINKLFTNTSGQLANNPSQWLETFTTGLAIASNELENQLALTTSTESKNRVAQNFTTVSIKILEDLANQLLPLLGKNNQTDTFLAFTGLKALEFLVQLNRTLEQNGVQPPQQLQLALNNTKQLAATALTVATKTPQLADVVKKAPATNAGLTTILDALAQTTLPKVDTDTKQLLTADIPSSSATDVVQKVQEARLLSAPSTSAAEKLALIAQNLQEQIDVMIENAISQLTPQSDIGTVKTELTNNIKQRIETMLTTFAVSDKEKNVLTQGLTEYAKNEIQKKANGKKQTEGQGTDTEDSAKKIYSDMLQQLSSITSIPLDKKPNSIIDTINLSTTNLETLINSLQQSDLPQKTEESIQSDAIKITKAIGYYGAFANVIGKLNKWSEQLQANLNTYTTSSDSAEKKKFMKSALLNRADILKLLKINDQLLDGSLPAKDLPKLFSTDVDTEKLSTKPLDKNIKKLFGTLKGDLKQAMPLFVSLPKPVTTEQVQNGVQPLLEKLEKLNNERIAKIDIEPTETTIAAEAEGAIISLESNLSIFKLENVAGLLSDLKRSVEQIYRTFPDSTSGSVNFTRQDASNIRLFAMYIELLGNILAAIQTQKVELDTSVNTITNTDVTTGREQFEKIKNTYPIFIEQQRKLTALIDAYDNWKTGSIDFGSLIFGFQNEENKALARKIGSTFGNISTQSTLLENQSKFKKLYLDQIKFDLPKLPFTAASLIDTTKKKVGNALDLILGDATEPIEKILKDTENIEDQLDKRKLNTEAKVTALNEIKTQLDSTSEFSTLFDNIIKFAKDNNISLSGLPKTTKERLEKNIGTVTKKINQIITTLSPTSKIKPTTEKEKESVTLLSPDQEKTIFDAISGLVASALLDQKDIQTSQFKTTISKIADQYPNQEELRNELEKLSGIMTDIVPFVQTVTQINSLSPDELDTQLDTMDKKIKETGLLYSQATSKLNNLKLIPEGIKTLIDQQLAEITKQSAKALTTLNTKKNASSQIATKANQIEENLKTIETGLNNILTNEQPASLLDLLTTSLKEAKSGLEQLPQQNTKTTELTQRLVALSAITNNILPQIILNKSLIEKAYQEYQALTGNKIVLDGLLSDLKAKKTIAEKNNYILEIQNKFTNIINTVTRAYEKLQTLEQNQQVLKFEPFKDRLKKTINDLDDTANLIYTTAEKFNKFSEEHVAKVPKSAIETLQTVITQTGQNALTTLKNSNDIEMIKQALAEWDNITEKIQNALSVFPKNERDQILKNLKTFPILLEQTDLIKQAINKLDPAIIKQLDPKYTK